MYGCRSLCARQSRQLESLSEKSIQDRTSSFDRSPLDLDFLKRLSRKALAAALQFQAFISDSTTTSELLADLRKWWRLEGQKLFSSPAMDECAFDMFDILPEMEEVACPAAATSEHQTAATQALQAVEDRARVMEEIKEVEASQTCGRDGGRDVEQQHLLQPHTEQNAPGSASPQILTNLVDLLQAALVTGGVDFNLDEATGRGEDSVLNRLAHMAPLMRSFIKHARLQEQVLSAATLNGEKQQMNPWNEREHFLAVARRAANASQVRLSKAQAWRSSEEKLSQQIRPQNSKATTSDPGLTPAEHYFPYNSKRFQVLLFLMDGELAIGLVLSAFRGAVVKKPGSEETIVKTARPFPEDLPSTSTKLLHVAACRYNSELSEYSCSCASRVSFHV